MDLTSLLARFRWVVWLCLVGVAFCASAQAQEPAAIALKGAWRFQLDPQDAGIARQLWRESLSERINLPGSIQEQGFGQPPTADTRWTSGIGAELLKKPKYAPFRQAGQFKTPFWLTPLRHYVGPAWFQRDLEIPAAWRGKRIVLWLERAHWQTSLWLDEQKIGSQEALGVAHEYDLTALASPGRHRLTLRVDNRVSIPVGVDAHSVSDQTQGNWNGMVGELKLKATEKLWIDDAQVYPDVAGRKIKLVIEIANATGAAGRGVLRASAASFNTAQGHAAGAKEWPVRWEGPRARLEVEYELGPDAPLWDEFSPALHRLNLELIPEAGTAEGHTVVFGLRELGVAGTQFTLNGRKIFLRGTLECCIFPLTGYPPTDVESWKRILRIARDHGLNHLRFHSWCPPEAAFVAADEMGFYYQVEVSCWAGFGDGSPVDAWVYDEARRMLKAYGNHPSFILMAPSNEPGGKERDRFLTEFVKKMAATDARRRYTAGSGWPMLADNQYHVTPAPRIQATNALRRPPQTAHDYRDFIARQKVPVVSHEIGQWCVYPSFDEIAKYTGSLKAGNLEIFRDFLDKSGMGAQAKDFLHASGRFQTLLYKEEIEAALRTPGMAGLQLLDLHDFPGQGTAPVGVLDAFWDSKGYVKPEEYRRFCNSTVLLARLAKRVFTADESADIAIEVAHFGPTDLARAKAAWRLRNASGQVLQQGPFEPRNIATGGLSGLGVVRLAFASLPSPARLNLEVSLDGTIANDWDFWVYPPMASTEPPAGIRIAEELDDDALATLDQGGKVLLLPGPARIAGETAGSFQPIFWNRITFPKQKIHTLGVLCNPRHPALSQFPTDVHSNWQWWELQENSKPMVLDGLPRALSPVVQMIDDWDVCRKLGLLIEARVRRGRLLLCSIDLKKNLETRPVARQLRRSLLDYMASDAFAPAVTLTPEQVRSLLRQPSLTQTMGARIVRASSQQPGYEAASILDGDVGTLWHSAWGENAPSFPHELVIAFENSAALGGCRLIPRQDGNRNGWIKDYAVYASADGRTWGQPLARGALERNSEPKEIRFQAPPASRFLKLVALSGFDSNPFASLAEMELLGQRP